MKNKALYQCNCGQFFWTGDECQVVLCPECYHMTEFTIVSDHGACRKTHDLRDNNWHLAGTPFTAVGYPLVRMGKS